MKLLISFVTLILITFSIKADNAGNSDFLTVNGKTYNFKNIKFGMSKIKIVDEAGVKMIFKNKEISSYILKGHLYERLPITNNQYETTGHAFMEFISEKNGMKLYKWGDSDEKSELVSNKYVASHYKDSYFVFQDGKFLFQVNENNSRNVFTFFGLIADSQEANN